VEQLRQRRHLLAQNSRFLILGDRGQYPNLATRGLALCCARLSDDWLQQHGHPILAVESSPKPNEQPAPRRKTVAATNGAVW